MHDQNRIFCKIGTGEIPTYPVYEDAYVIVPERS